MSPNTTIPYYHTDHGPGIFPRRRTFTPEETQWRKAAVSFLWERLQSPPASSSPAGMLREPQATYHVHLPPTDRRAKNESKRELREQLTEILFALRVVNEILKVQYGSPDWGNQPHVIDELVFILLTRRSKIEDAVRHLKAIRERFATWEDVAFASPDELKAVILGGGLEDDKVKFIQASLQAVHQKFGRIDEVDFAGMSDRELDKFLLELPGIGPKSSACILMYALDADIFPADTHCIRILNRLGLFASFGFEWSQVNHKQAEQELLLLIPPHMRSDLHRNLLALGREVCKPQKPLCDQCELRKFCAYYRQQQQAEHLALDAPTAIDVFCGTGGFSLGLRRAGFKVVAAVDNEPDAIRTYRLNHPSIPDENVMEVDAREVDSRKLKDLLNGRRLDLLAGGPPCQGFSMMGNRVPHKFENGDKKFGADYKFVEDERNHLFEAMINMASELEPRYIVIENVPGLGSAEIEEKSYAEYIGERLEAIRYRVKVIRLEAVNFGIPQKRHRYFILGSYEGEPTLNLEELENTDLPEEERTKLKHALYDLPALSVADGAWIVAHQGCQGQDADLYEKYLGCFNIRGSTCILFNHVSRFNNKDDVELYANLRQGETYQQLVERLEKELGYRPGFIKYSTKNFHDKYYRLEWEGQSKTIVSHLHKDGNSFVHPTQNRSISVREAARIQSFPDDYIFCGSRGPQFIQIGNAVPPVIAEAIGRVFIEAISNASAEEKESLK